MAKSLEADPSSPEAVFADYEQRRVSVAAVLAHGLGDAHSYQMYLRFLISHAKIVEAATTWVWVVSRSYANDKLANEYTSFLIQNGKLEAAADAWVQYAGKRDTNYPECNRIFNGSFESDPTGSQFDWTVEQTPGASIDFDTASAHGGSRSLRVQFDGTQNLKAVDVRQNVYLKPDRYRFEAYVRAKDISTDEGISFHIANEQAPNRLSFTTQPILGSSEWTLIQHSFIVPKNASGLTEVRLVRTPSLRFDNLVRGTLWVDEVRIRPEPTRPTTQQSITYKSNSKLNKR
jgi:hypothetical protein